MRKRVLLSSLIVAAVAVSSVVGVRLAVADTARAEPSGCSDSGGYTVCLTNPAQYDDGKDTTIIDQLSKQVGDAADDDSIRVSMYEWKLEPLAKDLAAAAERGVDVQVVLGTPDPESNGPVKKILTDSGIPVAQCEHSCLANGDGEKRGPNHSKFFLIEKGGTPHVLQFSANITKGQLTHAQNMLISHDDRALFDYYTGYWNRLNEGSWSYDGDTWGEDDKHGDGDKDSAKAYVFPRAKGDVIASVLKNVTACREGNDKVWVTQSIFNSERSEVLEQLQALLDKGCDVRVSLLHKEDHSWLTQHFPAERVQLRDSHNKLVVIDAQYADEWRGVVFTGSHNLSGNSLRNANDNVLRVIQPDVAAVYAEYSRFIFEEGAKPE